MRYKKNNKTNNKNSSITMSLAMYNEITIQCRVVFNLACGSQHYMLQGSGFWIRIWIC